MGTRMYEGGGPGWASFPDGRTDSTVVSLLLEVWKGRSRELSSLEQSTTELEPGELGLRTQPTSGTRATRDTQPYSRPDALHDMPTRPSGSPQVSGACPKERKYHPVRVRRTYHPVRAGPRTRSTGRSRVSRASQQYSRAGAPRDRPARVAGTTPTSAPAHFP